MADAFYWESSAFPLAVAPWRRDPTQQRVVKARVAVAEQRTPGFALRFDLELLGAEKRDVLTPGGHLMRFVNQRQMLQAFEFAFVGEETENRRPPGGGGGYSELLDQRLKKWLAGGGQVQAPPKEELARWLLAWMVVTPATESNGGDKEADEWLVLMCGEKGAEFVVEQDWDDFTYHESGDASEPVSDGGKDNGENDDDCDDGSGEDTESDDDLPPPYEKVEAAESESSSPDSDVEIDTGVLTAGKEMQRGAAVRPAETTRVSNSSRGWHSTGASTNKLSKRGSSIRSSSSRSLASTLACTTSAEPKEKPELKPTIVLLNPRLDSLDVVNLEEPGTGWSKDRRHFHQELRASRRAVQIAKQQHDKVEKLAHLRHTQLLKESARKLYVNEQKRRDAEAVRQLIADTLEYRDELYAMESRVKQASIAAHREQERVKRKTRAVLGNTEKTPRGAVNLGLETRSKKEMELYDDDVRDESAVYDLHGRRHKLEEADQIATKSALESAMRKVHRLLNSGESVEIFRRYDFDRSGTLSYSEFQRMLRENGHGAFAKLTQEQSMAFFKRFDANNSGEIDYGEMLWGFFNWEAFLKRWHERKSAPTDREVRTSFIRYDSSNRGILPLKEFQLVLDHLGVSLGDIDAKLLAVKFDAAKEGYIDYYQFLSSVNLSRTQDKSSSNSDKQSYESTARPNLHNDTAPFGMERIWMELQALTATQERLHRLLQK